MSGISDDWGRLSPPMAFSGTNYALQVAGGGPVKLGFTSSHPKSRLGSLQAASPFVLEIVACWPATKRHERALHEALAPYRLRNEWYHPVLPVWKRVLAEYDASLSREPERAAYLGKWAQRYGFDAKSFLHERITGISRHDLRPDLSRIFVTAPEKTEAAA